MTTLNSTQLVMDEIPRAEDAIAVKVLQRLGAGDPILRKGYEAWLEQRESDLRYEPLGTVVHRFTTPEIHELAIKFFLEDIEENAAILRLRLAKQRRQEALSHLHAGLAEHDLFFAKEGDNVNENRMEVRRVSKAQEVEFARKLVRFSRELAEGTSELAPERVASGEIPDYLQVTNIRKVTIELGEFIVAHPEAGKEMIRRICADPQFATQVEQDEQNPELLRFLAHMSNASRTPNRPKVNEIGFAAA